ncbi:MAG: carboxypeptidase-like regulatory domain-containing protein [Paludibacteraceae bacterium]|nr:carboxypeptidase-like regulatory domain-containing protein [Paludibacteraceae bacterium]
MLLLLPLSLLFSETIVVGTVIDAFSGSPIESANVYFKNSNTGCATNSEGVFMVRCELQKKSKLIVSAVGYKKETFIIEPGQQVGIQVELTEEPIPIAEIIVNDDENPALPLLRKVRENRIKNDITLRQEMRYLLNENKELYVSEINRKHLQRALWRSLRKGMLRQEDSTFLLPLYVSERQLVREGNETYLLADIQSKSLILTQTDFSALLTPIAENINPYAANISLFGKSFLSPLASSGGRYYHYFLMDSLLTVGTEKWYELHIHPKNPYQLVFDGSMWIDSASYAVRKTVLTIPKQTSVNYLSSTQISQTYNPDGTIRDETVSSILDFAIKSDTTHFFPTILIKNQRTGMPLSVDSEQEDYALQKDTLLYPSSSSAIDSLRHTPIVKVATFLAHIASTGNIPTGTFIEVGNIADIIGHSSFEGWNVGIPLTTNEKLAPWLELSAMASYGFHDRAYKGFGQAAFRLPVENRHILGVRYEDQYVRTDMQNSDCLLREDDILSHSMEFSFLLFRSLHVRTRTFSPYTRSREWKIFSYNDWTDNVETQFSIQGGKRGYGDPNVGYKNIPSMKYLTLFASVRLGWKERTIDRHFRRFHKSEGKYPTVWLNFEGGEFKTEKMSRFNLYAHLSVLLKQRVDLGQCGKLDYAFKAGYIFGNTPYPFLQQMPTNTSYTYDPFRFNLSEPYEYMFDKYLMLFVNWNMQGLLFNRIPGIRRLHLRELLEFKLAWGGLRKEHEKVLELPETTGDLRVPHLEAGVGIGNILRIAELHAVFRLTHNKNNPQRFWGIRFRLNMDF